MHTYLLPAGSKIKIWIPADVNKSKNFTRDSWKTIKTDHMVILSVKDISNIHIDALENFDVDALENFDERFVKAVREKSLWTHGFELQGIHCSISCNQLEILS